MLGGRELLPSKIDEAAIEEMMVEVALEEGVELERRPLGRVLTPKRSPERSGG